MKECSQCKAYQPSAEYYNDATAKDGKKSYCKTCSRAKYEERIYDPDKSKREQLKRKYGITPEDKEQMFLQQEGRCAICTKAMTLWGRTSEGACIDHCHEGGHIRALLCGNCNKGLGHFFDNPDFLLEALQYLAQHTTNNDNQEY